MSIFSLTSPTIHIVYLGSKSIESTLRITMSKTFLKNIYLINLKLSDKVLISMWPAIHNPFD